MESKDLNFDALESIPSEAMKEIHVTPVSDDITKGTETNAQSINEAASNGMDKNLWDTFSPGGNNTINNGFNQGTQLNAGSLINADIAISIVNIVVPVALVLLFKKTLNRTVSKNSFALTAAEKDTLKQPLQNYLNSINFQVQNPLNALLLVAGMIYGMKAVEVINEVPAGKFPASNPPETKVDGSIKKDNRGRKAGTTKQVIEARKRQSK